MFISKTIKNRLTKYRRRLLLGSVLLGLSFVGGFNAQAEEQDGPIALSLETVILFALNDDPDIGVANAQKAQAEAGIDEAASAFYPQVDIFGSYGREYNNPASASNSDGTQFSLANNTNDFSVVVNQFIFDGFATQEELKRRKELDASSAVQVDIAHENVIQDTIDSYLGYYQSQRDVELAQKFLRTLREVNNKVGLMVEAGAESKAKLSYANSRLTFARNEVQTAQSTMIDSLTDLEFLTGRLPTFRAIYPEIFDILELKIDDFLEVAQENNSSVALNEHDRQALVHEYRKQRAAFYPTINGLVEFNQTYDSGGKVGKDRTAGAYLELSYTLFDGFAREAATDRVRSQINEIDFRTKKVEKEIKQAIKLSYNQVLSLREELRLVEDEIVSNEELQTLYREQFEFGEGDILRLIEGEERLYNSYRRKNRVETDIARNIYTLMQNLGYMRKEFFCSSC
ncbi:MAG: TolC family protein [Pseudomonadota bacterium]|nr:TolC family protein [Pseudomonadota bacterium]